MAYEDLSYREALAVLETGEIRIIDPKLIFAAREKAKEALKIMTEKEEDPRVIITAPIVQQT